MIDPAATGIWAVVPAAGVGSRMNAVLPKQYLEIDGKPVLQHSIERLLAVDRVRGVVVALNPDDQHWDRVEIDTRKPVHTTTGGAERADSVLRALHELGAGHTEDAAATWVLVHDAVRPCVETADIDRLIDTALAAGSGAILASRVKDTIKRGDAGACILATIDRSDLWHAMTPQCFPLPALTRALGDAVDRQLQVTDEAAAMELAGHKVLLVESSDTNIKITRPDDLELAEFFLSGAGV